ncbi:16S rRNA (cytidine(1402)-2'-O)-methyltransferase [Lacimicrobium alkaliphilum]|uniref:Ribosomal RNA small subunit methyltransferase I n=1 Tax=Lacimicrobium alkaliphilum TaxID=1526571 RepID=A0ABQ1QXM6_9ALTE|nr:16S rRNA (cytidine(1402)-2'-O)-methyltransferase [Lacimicrobium alkaliphilum]GGD51060.1 ribosomal RNA small subunit methyltransferase I [Lacimicrobium alkaliphilum]
MSTKGESASGTLYIVATPIGNLADISHRGLQVLQQVAVIAAEDTRHSKGLLDHYNISARLLSLHDHNETQRAQQLLMKLNEGLDIALISDAGTPLISDPGYQLVNLCRRNTIPVVPIPGACALITALCASGLPTDQFTFFGFLPVREMARREQLAELKDASGTAVFYEAPRRILDSVLLLIEELGADRQLALAKELTKTFETFRTGPAAEIAQWLQADPVHQKGEFVLMVGPGEDRSGQMPAEAINLLTTLMQELPLKKAAAITAGHYKLKKNALYQLGLQLQQ